MRNWSKYLLVLIVMTALDGYGQASLDTLLRIVADNNRELQAAMKQYEADLLSFRVGNTPPNPLVEYGQLWGDPSSVGKQVDFSITQLFDFPTTYTSQSKLRRINSGQAELQLTSVRQEVLATARKKWVEAVHLNRKLLMLRQRLDNAEVVSNGFQRKLETGEANLLDRNQAYLKMMILRNEYNVTVTVVENNRNELRNLCGGEEIIIPDTLFPPPAEIILDSLLSAYGQGPANLWYKGEVERWDQQKDVIFNNKLPKLMAGYYSESTLGADMRGARAGLTIPLWGNAHAVNRAKAARMFAEADAWRYQADERTRITNLYSRWVTLKEQVDGLVEAVVESNTEALLNRGLETGELSLTQYFYESDFYFQARMLIIDSWRDLLLVEAELMKIYY
jgi:outer membrane protein TolC